jgi:Rieske Fe-S protein
MPTDLDTQIRGLVVEVVESAPPPPELDLSAELTPTRTRRPIALVVIGIAVVVTLVATAVAVVSRNQATSPASSNGGTVTLGLDSIPKGVSARTLHGIPVFLVRDGRQVTVFLSDPQHITGDTKMWWCPSERLFVGPRFGEAFDRSGRAVGGPAPSGLDRLATRVEGSDAMVQLSEVVPDTRPRGVVHWPNTSAVFCDHHVEARGSATSLTLPVASLPTGVSSGLLGNTAVFFVRDDDRVRVFISNAQHLKGETTLWWCPAEKLFYAPTHGETFGPNGRILGGPQQRGLDRIRTKVRTGLVTIERHRVIEGSRNRPTNEYRAPPCADPLVSGP